MWGCVFSELASVVNISPWRSRNIVLAVHCNGLLEQDNTT